MFEIEKKYNIPQEAIPRLREAIEARYGAPRSLQEEDLHGYTSPTKNYLRLRRSGSELKLIAKGPSTVTFDGIKQRLEVEIPIAQAFASHARQLVELLIVEPLPGLRRERLVWQAQSDAEIVMDFLEALPDSVFVEVEVLSTDQETAREQLRELERQLGLHPEWQELRNYGQILQDCILFPPA
ncbi:MAG: CYTH domain-containing protein [Gemmatimonadaceae bacterium]|nr:CYTH domain-containing protein [Gloeobacterales cyanobacterium ES-bin-141]